MARRDEVDEFLRRAAARRAQGAAKGRPATAPPQRPAPPPARLPELVPIEAEVVDAELADTADRVARQVERDLSTQDIVEHASRLGEEVDQADEKLESHLQQVFDHRVGQLKTRAGDSVPQPLAGPQRVLAAVTPADLTRMLTSPQHVRNSIVIAEILRRPEERW